ncbi:MAG: FtsX-like permease family protein [Thermoleophilia bacterium]|nr:FtsX-like permease family protein [Thermoleophilia bacterium]
MSGPPGGPRLWLRWTWRDFKDRWLLVLAIAALLGLGTALFAGFESQINWRIASYDESFSLLNVHDLRVELPEGAYVDEGTLLAAASDAGVKIDTAEERLVEATQIEVGQGEGAILSRGRIVGAGGSGGPAVDMVSAHKGELPTGAASGSVVLEANFGKYHDLPTSGQLKVGGDRSVAYRGHGLSPEYFIVTDDHSSFSSEANLGVLFASLSEAQRLAGRPGEVNDLVIDLPPGADVGQAQARLSDAFARAGRGVTVSRTEDIYGHRLLYEDADNDQKLFTIFAVLVLLGAALAAFNLISRVVDSQRREMGIAMALGLSGAQAALRPALLGAQIAVAGVVLGAIAGELVSRWMAAILRSLILVPVLTTPFQASAFLTGGLLGLAVIAVATSFAVWRALRLNPIDAINVGPRMRKGRNLAWLVRAAHLPGGSIQQMPLRNLLRAPQRTLASVLAIGAVITVVVALLGVLDGFRTTVSLIEDEALGATPARTQVDLDGFYPASSAPVASVMRAESVGESEPVLRLVGAAANGGDPIDVVVETADAESAIWSPTIITGELGPSTTGILLSRQAARDLGAEVGDRIILSHPRLSTDGQVNVVFTELAVAGTHPNPLRFLAYVSRPQAEELIGTSGVVNALRVVPRADRTPDDVARELFGSPGIASVQAVRQTTDELQEGIEQFISFLAIPIVIALMLALLIAFNSTSISADERVREHATMFAFGVPVRSVIAVNVIESALVGAAATVIGLAAGGYITNWVMTNQLREVLPDLEAVADLSIASIVIAGGAGILAVAVAPLLTIRRLRRLDLPSSLRVVE